jgi:hypothetical protein
MRVVKEFKLSPTIKGTIFSWNGKFIVKLEDGHLEQTYKIAEMDITGQEDVDQLVASPEFIQKAEHIFEQMHANLEPIF